MNFDGAYSNFLLRHFFGIGLLMISFNVDAAEKTVTAAGVSFHWTTSHGELHGCMRAPTHGWIAVGFNPNGELAGARLVMARVLAGKAQIEVHIAKPPTHVHRKNQDGSERAQVLSSMQALQHNQTHTEICFRMPLAAADDEDIALVPGETVHLILAYSHEADFQHHSARRDGVKVTL
jgi:hypothetical protein